MISIVIEDSAEYGTTRCYLVNSEASGACSTLGDVVLHQKGKYFTGFAVVSTSGKTFRNPEELERFAEACMLMAERLRDAQKA